MQPAAKGCPSKVPARESWLLRSQKMGSEMVSGLAGVRRPGSPQEGICALTLIPRPQSGRRQLEEMPVRIAEIRERRAGRACHLLLCVVIAGTVADDDWIGLLNGPWRREAALGHKRRDGPGLHERELPNAEPSHLLTANRRRMCASLAPPRHNGQAVAYVYFEEPGRPAAHLLTRETRPGGSPPTSHKLFSLQTCRPDRLEPSETGKRDRTAGRN